MVRVGLQRHRTKKKNCLADWMFSPVGRSRSSANHEGSRDRMKASEIEVNSNSCSEDVRGYIARISSVNTNVFRQSHHMKSHG